MGQTAERLENLIEPGVTALGYELLGVEYLPQGRHSLLRIYIDRETGITVEDCERVSRQVSALFEVEDPIQGQYTLEVSSPGVDRPLFKPAHYQRYVGSMVQVRLKVPFEGRRKYKGRLVEFSDNRTLVEVEGRQYEFSLEDIEKAHIVPEW